MTDFPLYLLAYMLGVLQMTLVIKDHTDGSPATLLLGPVLLAPSRARPLALGPLRLRKE